MLLIFTPVSFFLTFLYKENNQIIVKLVVVNYLVIKIKNLIEPQNFLK